MPGSHYGICEKCGGTIYRMTYGEAQKAKLCSACASTPIPAETGTVSPPSLSDGLQPYQREAISYVQMIGRGKRPTHGGKMADMLAQSSRVVDYAGSKTARLSGQRPPAGNGNMLEHKAEMVKQDPSLVEQLARRLETFADDNDAMASRRRLTITDAREMKSAAHTFRSSAKELRDAMTAQNKALYQVEINTILERFGVSETVKDDISLAIVKEFMG